MSKFTFFTILFSLIVIVIVGQLVLKDAIFPQEYKTQVITEEIKTEAIQPEEVKSEEVQQEEPAPAKATAGEPLSVEEPRESEFQTILEQSGFVDIKEAPFSGKLFELFDFGTYQPDSTTVFQMNDLNSLIGIAAEIQLQDEITAQELYTLLQNKTKVYTELSINETNSYGDRSFYINHKKKPDEAFLIVRMKNVLYGLAYVKSYHPRIKTLISLLYTAILDESLKLPSEATDSMPASSNLQATS